MEKLTDNEIIKCAENCTSDSPSCGICLYNDDRLTSSECMGELMKDLFDLTNRQQAEIERLKAEAQMADGYEDALVEMTKSEAIKEFAERLKNLTKYYWLDEINIDHIDNLVKEMTE